MPGQGEHTEHQLRTLVEGVPHLIWRSCDRGLWTWASPQWLAYTGQSQDGSHGRGWLDVVHPDDRGRTLAAWEAASPHGELDVEFRLRRASDGAWVWHRTASLPLRDASGRIIEWLGSTTEIQAYKDLQARQQELLAAAERHARELEEEIAQRRRAEARLAHAASHDGLTDLHNRAWFMERLGAGHGRRRHGVGRLLGAVPGPGPLRIGQRHARPPGRRPAAGRGRPAAAGVPGAAEHAGAAGWRRVRGAGGGRARMPAPRCGWRSGSPRRCATR